MPGESWFLIGLGVGLMVLGVVDAIVGKERLHSSETGLWNWAGTLLAVALGLILIIFGVVIALVPR